METAVDAAAQSVGRERLRAMDHAAWRIAQLMVLIVVLVSVYTAALLWLKRKRSVAKARPPSEEMTS